MTCCFRDEGSPEVLEWHARKLHGPGGRLGRGRWRWRRGCLQQRGSAVQEGSGLLQLERCLPQQLCGCGGGGQRCGGQLPRCARCDLASAAGCDPRRPAGTAAVGQPIPGTGVWPEGAWRCPVRGPTQLRVALAVLVALLVTVGGSRRRRGSHVTSVAHGARVAGCEAVLPAFVASWDRLRWRQGVATSRGVLAGVERGAWRVEQGFCT